MCTKRRHKRLLRSIALFVYGTHSQQPWNDGRDEFLMGCCRECGSHLSYQVRRYVPHAEELMAERDRVIDREMRAEEEREDRCGRIDADSNESLGLRMGVSL